MILLNIWDEWIMPTIIDLCMAIMGFVKTLLNLIFDIANISFFSEDVISELFTRAYIVVGIIMVFKIVISCIQYLINPDKIDDKESGFGGIVKRTIISVLLLALVPTLFDFAKSAQNAIVETLPKLILGQEGNYDLDTIGDTLAFTTTRAFFNYTSDACNDNSIGDSLNSNAGNNATFNSIDDILKDSVKISTATCNGGKRYDFQFYFLLPVGIYLIFILVSMALDVATRVIKFGFLELIAPIPIASYIDPKSSKKSFDSWVHNSISIYADLFIRLGIIYLVLYLFMILLPSFSTEFVLNDGTKLSTSRSLLVNVAIIIALLMFAKNAPKFICDVLGIKDGGNYSDMFKRATGIAGAGYAGLRAARSNYTTQKERWLGKGAGKATQVAQGLRSAAAGFGSASARGLKSAALDGKGFRDVNRSALAASNKARDARIDREDNLYGDDYNWFSYRHDVKRAKLGIPSGDEFVKIRYDAMKNIAKMAADAKGHGTGKMNETPSWYDVKLGNDESEKIIKEVTGFDKFSMADIRNLKQTAVNNGNQITDAHGKKIKLNDRQLSALDDVVQKIEKRTSYLKEAHMMSSGDPAATGYLGSIELAIKTNASMFTDKDTIDAINDKLEKKLGRRVANANDLLSALKELKYDKSLEKKPDEGTPEYNNWLLEIEKRADILTGFKDAFEEVEKLQKIPAQIADERAKKAQKAVQNNDKKGS